MARNPLKSELDELKVLQKTKVNADLQLKLAESEATGAQAKLAIAINKVKDSCNIEHPLASLDMATGTKWVLRGQTPDGQTKEIPLVEEDKKLKVVEQPKVEDKTEQAAN